MATTPQAESPQPQTAPPASDLYTVPGGASGVAPAPPVVTVPAGYEAGKPMVTTKAPEIGAPMEVAKPWRGAGADGKPIVPGQPVDPYSERMKDAPKPGATEAPAAGPVSDQAAATAGHSAHDAGAKRKS